MDWTLRTRLVLGLPVLLASATAYAEIPYADEITPGALRGIAWAPGDEWPVGYWEYLPSNYDEVVPDGFLYPTLITLGGIGTLDDPSNCPGDSATCTVEDCAVTDGLCRALRRGPAVTMANSGWDDVARPFIIFTPQNPAPTNSTVEYDVEQLDELVTFAIENYPVDPRRIYLLGNSQGGRAVLQYTTVHARRLAAATMGPGGVVSDEDAACHFEDTAFWALHGENDADANLGAGVFSPCWVVQQVAMYDHPELYPQHESCMDRVGTPYPDGRMTMFFNRAHNVWTPAYEDIPFGQFSTTQWPSDQGCGVGIEFTGYTQMDEPDGVYTWMLRYDRPDTQAPEDFEVSGDADSFELTATTIDEDTLQYTWTQLEGDPVTITNADAETATVTDFSPESTYTFEVYVLDADNQWDRDEVIVTVTEASAATDSSGGETTTGDDVGDDDDDDVGDDDDDVGDDDDDVGDDDDDDAGADDTVGNGDGTPPPAVTEGGDDESGSGDGGAQDGESGCSCASQGPPAWSSAWLVLLALIRRRAAPNVSAAA